MGARRLTSLGRVALTLALMPLVIVVAAHCASKIQDCSTELAEAQYTACLDAVMADTDASSARRQRAAAIAAEIAREGWEAYKESEATTAAKEKKGID